METVNDLIDKAREAMQAESDNQLAIKLKVTRQAVSGWRRNAHTPDTVMCAKLAEITGIPLARVLGIVGEARAISREEKAVWRRLASAALVLLTALPLGSKAGPYGYVEQQHALCIMRNARWVARFLSTKLRKALRQNLRHPRTTRPTRRLHRAAELKLLLPRDPLGTDLPADTVAPHPGILAILRIVKTPTTPSPRTGTLPGSLNSLPVRLDLGRSLGVPAGINIDTSPMGR